MGGDEQVKGLSPRKQMRLGGGTNGPKLSHCGHPVLVPTAAHLPCAPRVGHPGILAGAVSLLEEGQRGTCRMKHR